MSDTARRNKRIMTAIVGVLGATAIFVPILGVLLIPGGLSKNSETSVAAPTTTKPPLNIKPLPVRPVLTAFVIKPRIARRRPSARRRICRFGSATSPGPLSTNSLPRACGFN